MGTEEMRIELYGFITGSVSGIGRIAADFQYTVRRTCICRAQIGNLKGCIAQAMAEVIQRIGRSVDIAAREDA